MEIVPTYHRLMNLSPMSLQVCRVLNHCLEDLGLKSAAVSLTLSWGLMETLVPWLTASRARCSMASIVNKYWSRAASFSGSSLEMSKPSFEVIDAVAVDFVSNLFLNWSTIQQVL